MDEWIKELSQDVKEIRTQMVEMVKHQAVMNQTLIEHERRSTNLETRVVPIENDYNFRSKLMTIFVRCGGFAVLVKAGSLLATYFH